MQTENCGADAGASAPQFFLAGYCNLYKFVIII